MSVLLSQLYLSSPSRYSADDEAVLAAEDDMDGGLHDALALGQKWDGRGTFRAERASATTGRAEELLTRCRQNREKKKNVFPSAPATRSKYIEILLVKLTCNSDS